MSRGYLTGKTRSEERAIQQRAQSRVANRISTDIRAELERAMEEVIDEYAKEGGLPPLGELRSNHEERLKKALRGGWRSAVDAGGRRILDQSKAVHGRGWIYKSSAEEAFEERVSRFIKEEAGRRVVGMSKSTISMIKRRISGLEDRDKSVDEVARDLRKSVPVLGAARSMMIARTESHSAYNAGHKAAAEASSLELKREWISAQDERTRDGTDGPFDHEAADGETVGRDEDFTRTGESLQYPGDPAGSSGNVINCRCGVGDIVV